VRQRREATALGRGDKDGLQHKRRKVLIAAQEVRCIDCSSTCATRRGAALHSILAAILESPAGSSFRIASMKSSMTCTPFSPTRPSRLLLSSLIMVGARRRSARQAIFKSQSNTGFPYGVSPSTPHRIEPLHVYTFVRESRRDKTSCHPTVRISKKLKGCGQTFSPAKLAFLKQRSVFVSI